MNFVGKFEPSHLGSSSVEGSTSLSGKHVDTETHSHNGLSNTVTIANAHLLFSGDYERSGTDLIISDHDHRVVVHDYFRGEKRPTLVSSEGAPLDAKVIEALTGHTAYAQAGGAISAAKVIGHVVKISGSASVVRNGVAVELNNGDNVNQGDVAQTGSNSTLGLVLIDGTTFNLSANARLMLNDMVYDPNGSSNSSLLTLVQGAAGFVAGQVAKTGDMKVATPVATMGIRGTAVTLDIDSVDGKVRISVVDQHDNIVHAVEVRDRNGNLIGTVTSNGTSLTLTPTATFEVIAQQTNKSVADVAQEFNAFQSLLSTYDLGKQMVPSTPPPSDGKRGDANPQSTPTKLGSAPILPSNAPSTTVFQPVKTASTTTSADDGSPTQPNSTVTPPPTTQVIITQNGGTTTVDVPATPLPFVVTPATFTKVSSGPGDHFGPVMSADGHFVTYDPDGAIYLYDRQTGATITIASPTEGMTYGSPTISADGHTIVYQGTDGTHNYVFIYDNNPSDENYGHTTQLGAGGAPAVSGDGSRIAVENGSGGIVLYDQQGHVLATITPAAVAAIVAAGGGAAGSLDKPAISADGHVIAFWNADPTNPEQGTSPGELLVYNLATGTITEIATTKHVAGAHAASFSADGHYVVFESDAALAGTDGAHSEIFLYDLTTGQIVFHTDNAAGGSYHPVISPDGHYIIFASDAKLTANDTNSVADMYVVDLTHLANPVYNLVSVLADGTLGNAASNLGGTISAGGLYVAFGSDASNFATGDTNGGGDIFVVDPTSGHSAVIQETANSPSILSTGGTIALTGETNGITISVSDPTGRFIAGFDANHNIQWTFNEAKSDFAFLKPGEFSVQDFVITLTSGTSTTTIPVKVTVFDADLPPVVVADVAPVAAPVTLAQGQEDTPYIITTAALLAGVTDIDSTSLTITSLSVHTGYGTLHDNGDGTWTYTPAANDHGPVTFDYTASDGTLTAASTANLEIASVNDAPVITSAGLAVTPGVPHLLSASDIGVTDPDNTSFTFTATVTHGSFQIESGENTWTDTSTFTTADLLAGHVRFVSDGGTKPPTISLVASDGLADSAAFDMDVEFTASNYHLTSTAGVSIDVSPAGATSGFVFPGAGNVTTPGDPEDRIALGYVFGDDTVVLNSAPMEGVNGFTPISSETHSIDGTTFVTATLGAGHGVTLTQTIALGSDANYFTTTIDVFNGGTSDLTNVRFLRNIDPDQDVQQYGDYNTSNDVVQNPTESESFAIVSATGLESGVQVALVGLGGAWRGSVYGFTNTNPYANGAFDHPVDPNGAQADKAISLTYDFGTILAGQHVEVTYFTTTNVATEGSNALVGTVGADTINGLGGDDLLIGLGGADTFVFAPGSGHDTIYDFTAGTDVIDVRGFGGLPDDFSTWKTAGILEAAGDDTLLHLSATDTVLLKNVTIDSLSADDFRIDATPTGGTPDLAAASDSGASNSDNNTKVTAPTFTVALDSTVAAGDTVKLLLGDSVLITYTIDADDISAHSVSLTLADGALGADGSKSISAEFSDSAGHSSTTSALQLTLDTTAPDVTITSSGGTTNHASQTVSGTSDADPGTEVRLYDNGSATSFATAHVGSDGHWTASVTLSGDGTHSIVAQDTDAAGNTGASPTPVVFTLDTTAPTITITSSGSTTQLAEQSVSGTSDADPGTEVRLYDNGSTTAFATAYVGSDGHWTASVTLSGDGTHSIVAQDTDALGNTGASPTPVVFTLDTVAPTGGTPDLADASDSGTSSTDDITNVTAPTFTVAIDSSVAIGDTVKLKMGDFLLAEHTVNADDISTGNVSLQVADGALETDGVKSVTAEFSDAAGHSSTTDALTFTLDTTAPTVTINPDSIVAGQTEQTIFGMDSAGAGSTVALYDNGDFLGTAYVGSDGSWNKSVTLSDGAHSIVAQQTDDAGNTGSSGAAVFTLDATTPTGGMPDLADASDSGSSTTDDITNVTAPTFTVTLDSTVAVGDTVELLLNGASLTHPATHTVTQDDIDNGSVSLQVTDGDLGSDAYMYFSALFSDAAGNTSSTDSLSVDLDTSAPTVTLSDNGGPTTQVEQTISGHVDQNDIGTVTLTDNGVPLDAEVQFGSYGDWSATVTLSGDGEHHIVAHETDTAGNVGLSNEVVFTLDTTPDNQPPMPEADSATITAGDGAVSGNVLDNDSDPDFDALSVTSVNGVTGADAPAITVEGIYGELVIDKATGAYTYTLGADLDQNEPMHAAQAAAVAALAGGATAQDVFDYVAYDGQYGSNANLTVDVTGTNDAPSITGDLAVLAVKGGSIAVTTADLNVADPDALPGELTFTLGSTSHGSLWNSHTGSQLSSTGGHFTLADIANGYIYFATDNSFYVGQGGFTVSVSDGIASTPATTTVGVTIVDAQITVQAAGGYDFDQDNPIAAMGLGNIDPASEMAQSFHIVNASADREFIIVGAFDYEGAVPAGTITSIQEVIHSTQTSLARFDLDVDATAWLNATTAYANGNHGPMEAMTGSWVFNFIGGAGSDGYRAGSFNDYFSGRGGNDLLDGDFGYDRANYGAATGAINVQLAAGTVDGDGSVGHDTLRSIELVTGSNFADTFNATGFSAASANSGSTVTNNTGGLFNEFEGRGGDDLITGNGQTRVSYYHATAGVTVTLDEGSWTSTSSGASGSATGDASVGHDTFTGGVNQVRGSSFNDTFNGSTNLFGTAENFDGMAGNDTINGGGGFDRAGYNQASDGTGITVNLADGTVTGGPDTGTDTLQSVEAIWGTNFNDTYNAGATTSNPGGFSATSTNAGSAQNSATDSNPSNFNEFEGAGGDDTITGNGNTRIAYYHATGGVVVTLGDNNLIHGSAVGASTGVDDIVSGVSRVRGSEFNDVITGNGVSNFLEGQGGNDVLNGGTADHASDTFVGGTGADIFVYARGDANDVISDFHHTEADRIDLRSFTTIHSISDLIFSTVTVSGDPNSTRITSSVSNAFDATANDRILLQGVDHNTLQASDFIFAGEVAVTMQTADGYDFGTLYGDLAASNPVQVANDGSHLFAVDTLKGITFELTGTGFTYNGDGLVTGGTINKIDILGTTNTSLTTQDHVLVNTNGWNIDATSFFSAVGDYAGNHSTSGLDAIFNAATYSIVGSAGGSTPNGDNGSGTDVFFGSDHADVFNGMGPFGNDTVDYSHATTGITANLLAPASNSGAAAAGDTYISIENLRGTNFDDHLTGDGSNNVLEGGLGNNMLNGGSGTDTASYEHATAGVTVSLASSAPQNTGGAGTDALISIENLRGSAFDDTLTGDGNDNVLEGGPGNDVLDGGGGNNTASYEHATAGVTVNLNAAGAQNTIGAGTDTLTNIQNLTGSQFNDTLTGDANDNNFFGLGGNDTFVFKQGFGHDTIADFTPGRDNIEFDFDPTAFGGSNPGTFEMWLSSHAQASQSNANDTLIKLDDLSQSSILLKNVNVANLHASDFIVPH